MRFAHFSIPWCAAAALTAALPIAGAQAAPPSHSSHSGHATPADSTAPDWLQPSAPSRPLRYLPLPASGGVEQASTAWPAANAAVGQFPRGHADVLQWEKSQAAAAQGTAAPAPSAPAAAHGHYPHGGQR
ncbi:MAG: hypothetical protein RR855_18025 [Comamonas sp.]